MIPIKIHLKKNLVLADKQYGDDVLCIPIKKLFLTTRNNFLSSSYKLLTWFSANFLNLFALQLPWHYGTSEVFTVCTLQNPSRCSTSSLNCLPNVSWMIFTFYSFDICLERLSVAGLMLWGASHCCGALESRCPLLACVSQLCYIRDCSRKGLKSLSRSLFVLLFLPSKLFNLKA